MGIYQGYEVVDQLLYSGNKQKCTSCKSPLQDTKSLIFIRDKRKKKRCVVNEGILFCEACQAFYVSRQQLFDIEKKYPGYYVEKKKHSPEKITSIEFYSQTDCEEAKNHELNYLRENAIVESVLSEDNKVFSCCNDELSSHQCRFIMHRFFDDSMWIVEDELAYCPVCGTHYATKEVCYRLTSKYIGFHLKVGKQYRAGSHGYIKYSKETLSETLAQERSISETKKNFPLNYVTLKSKECGIYSHRLSMRTASFYMRRTQDDTIWIIEDKLYYCNVCDKYHADKPLCRNLAKKYPGLVLELGRTYKGTQEAKRYVHKLKDQSQQIPNNANIPIASESERQPERAENVVKKQSYAFSETPLTAPLHIQEYGWRVCPMCNSTLDDHSVNVPIVNENGDFQNYIVGKGLYCYRCREGFVTPETIKIILQKQRYIHHRDSIVQLKGGFYRRNTESIYSDEYLFYPTLDRNSAITLGSVGQFSPSLELSPDSDMYLSAESFLKRMGYSVSVRTSIRRKILTDAVERYGKRKVSDHLHWLIATRKAQQDGAYKYANALSIWQNDLNYIFDL